MSVKKVKTVDTAASVKTRRVKDILNNLRGEGEIGSRYADDLEKAVNELCGELVTEMTNEATLAIALAKEIAFDEGYAEGREDAEDSAGRTNHGPRLLCF